ncbi:hypothetical protein PsorP6_010583 [Peronosclerospora sorghi]|uniref:Uncharacterized protein n=1 Tax=Peronosclerospora sorghi TaxID=230839 RepID=A0ACC0VWF8_9STRA|nr:hypothetical protein PsorP6_010583 [Peronosclerospora sorghi]
MWNTKSQLSVIGKTELMAAAKKLARKQMNCRSVDFQIENLITMVHRVAWMHVKAALVTATIRLSDTTTKAR